MSAGPADGPTGTMGRLRSWLIGLGAVCGAISAIVLVLGQAKGVSDATLEALGNIGRMDAIVVYRDVDGIALPDATAREPLRATASCPDDRIALGGSCKLQWARPSDEAADAPRPLAWPALRGSYLDFPRAGPGVADPAPSGFSCEYGLPNPGTETSRGVRLGVLVSVMCSKDATWAGTRPGR